MQENDRHLVVENKSSNRSFGITLAGFFAIVAIWPLFKGQDLRVWALVITGLFLLPALLFPKVLKPLNLVWFKFGLVLHKIISPIVLGIMFYALLTPMALIARVLKKDLLRLKLDKHLPSYWIPRDPPGPSPESLSNQF
jgi:hypothetical protein